MSVELVEPPPALPFRARGSVACASSSSEAWHERLLPGDRRQDGRLAARGAGVSPSRLTSSAMETWTAVLITALVANAALGLGYRIYRWTKGGPKTDVWGQSVLAFLLVAIATGLALDVDWLRWPALGYAVLFAFLAMPVWVLGVLLPMRPRAVDYAFTATYWALLFVIGVAAVLA